jgi:8-oxo-dGTP diphosphatase
LDLQPISESEIRELIDSFPALKITRNRESVFIFRPFDQTLASRVCAYSYVIPFVSETDCLITLRANGKWVLPGGTLEPGESWVDAAGRELMEETGSRLLSLHPIGMYHCFSQESQPRRPHLPHSEFVRVVSWADAEQLKETSDPDTRSKIVEVRAIHYKEASVLFGPETPDFGELYRLAFEVRKRQKS